MSVWLPPSDAGVRVLGLALGGYALSPDDALLACWADAEPETLVCLEVASGREVFTAVGDWPITALAWTSPEQLVAVRSSADAARLELVAVPDGGLLDERELADLAAPSHDVTLSADGRAACVARRDAGPTDASLPLAVVLHLAGMSVRRVVAATAFDEASANIKRRAAMAAAMDPDGCRLAVATGPSRLSPGGGRTGALWTLDLDAAAPERTASLGNLPPCELAWWSPSRVMVRAARLDADASWNRVRGALHVVDVDARRVIYDALAPPRERDAGVRSRWLEPWVHASPSPDGARMVLGAEGVSRTSAAGTTLTGRVRVVDLDTGRSEEPVELDTRVAVAPSAVFEGDGLVTLTTRRHREATLSWALAGATPGRRATVAFRGDATDAPPAAAVSGMRLTRSPAGRYLVVHGHERTERGRLVGRLALVDARE